MVEESATSIFYRKYPSNIREKDKYLFDPFIQRKIIAAVSKRTIQNAYVNHEGQVWRKLKLIRDVSFYRKKDTIKNYFTELKHLVKQHFKKETVKIGTACWIADAWSMNYFHWLIDALQRYTQVRRSTSDEFLVLLPENFRDYPYIIGTLSALRIQHYFIRKDQLIKVARLFIPDFYHPPGTANNDLISAMRKGFEGFLNNTANSKQERIFISRNHGSKRTIANEDVLFPVLKKYGFEIFYTEELTFLQQVSLFRNAKIIAGLHGAGLTNMLFANSAKIMELRSKDMIDQWCYFELASALGHQYFYLLCDIIPDEKDLKNSGVTVDRDKFEMLLASVIKTNEPE